MSGTHPVNYVTVAPASVTCDSNGNLLPDGSISLAYDAGNRLAINRYDEYGIPASTNIGQFQYTGQSWIGERGARVSVQ